MSLSSVQRLENTDLHGSLLKIRDQMRQTIRGQESVIDLSLACFLAGGHLLLEGPPGVGKTTLARGLSKSFEGSFCRIQMTSDLLPSEIVGILRPSAESGGREFEFRKGPIFTNFLLADELNRTSPKTQAALLEGMAEGTVTVDGKTYPLPDPFFVIATQNPSEFYGVFPLAESQLDRFMLHVRVQLPKIEDELAIYTGVSSIETITAQLNLSQVRRLREDIQKIFVEKSVLDYAYALIQKTREAPGVSCGVSVRGGLQWIAAAKALAFLKGRDFTVPSDIRDLAVPALAHRLRLSEGVWELEPKRKLIAELLESIPSPS